MRIKYKKIMIYLFSIVIIIISSFCMYQYSTLFSSRDKAIEKYLTLVFNNDPTQLVEVVETDVTKLLFVIEDKWFRNYQYDS